MTNSESKKLDKIEALIEPNARAIEAIGNERRGFERSIALDRVRLYRSLTDLTSTQAVFYQRPATQDKLIETRSRRQVRSYKFSKY